MNRALTLGLRTGTVLTVALLLGWMWTGAAGARDATASAAGWTEGACADAGGVTVAVDFQQLGAGTALRCAPGPAADGFDALSRAGISFQTATRFPGFLCRIVGLPTNDPCIAAAPATAYWSYWLAARGGPWCYSNLGAGNRRPPPGTVEGWSFSLTSDGATAPPPRVAVPDPIAGAAPATLGAADCDSTPPAPVPVTPGSAGPVAQLPEPGPDTPPGVSPTPEGTEGAAADPGPSGATPVDGATTIAPSTTAAAADTPTGSGPATSSGSADTRRTDDNGGESEEAVRVDLGDDGTSGGASPLGVVLALALIGALGAAAYLVRRRAAHD